MCRGSGLSSSADIPGVDNAVIGLLNLAAAGTPTAGVDLNVFAQYGLLGAIAAGLIWFAKGAHQRERDRVDALEAENKRLNGIIQDRVIPALTSATRAAEESADLLNAMQREREQHRLLEQRRVRIEES